MFGWSFKLTVTCQVVFFACWTLQVYGQCKTKRFERFEDGLPRQLLGPLSNHVTIFLRI